MANWNKAKGGGRIEIKRPGESSPEVYDDVIKADKGEGGNIVIDRAGGVQTVVFPTFSATIVPAPKPNPQ